LFPAPYVSPAPVPVAGVTAGRPAAAALYGKPSDEAAPVGHACDAVGT
jgi:hypothetical protein